MGSDNDGRSAGDAAAPQRAPVWGGRSALDYGSEGLCPSRALTRTQQWARPVIQGEEPAEPDAQCLTAHASVCKAGLGVRVPSSPQLCFPGATPEYAAELLTSNDSAAAVVPSSRTPLAPSRADQCAQTVREVPHQLHGDEIQAGQNARADTAHTKVTPNYPQNPQRIHGRLSAWRPHLTQPQFGRGGSTPGSDWAQTGRSQ